MKPEPDQQKLLALQSIMSAVHALADVAWPDDNVPKAGLAAIIDVQISAAAALGLPDDLPLLSGDPLIDDI